MAKAILAALLSASVLAAIPTGSAPVAPAQAAVAHDGGSNRVQPDAGRLADLARTLDESLGSCLNEQARLLGQVVAGSGSRASAAAALEARRASLARSIRPGEAPPGADEAVALAPAGALRDRLVHRAGLHRACLDWSGRSVEGLRIGLAGDGKDLAAFGAMAGRDVSYLRLIARRHVTDLNPIAIEAMETFGGGDR